MQWLRPFQAKLPYGNFGKWKNSPFTRKIRQALGWRLDEDGNNTTHRQDATQPNGVDIPARSNICHVYEQDSATADAVIIKVAGTGRNLNMQGVNNDASLINFVVNDTLANRPDIFRVYQEDGTFILRMLTDGSISTVAP